MLSPDGPAARVRVSGRVQDQYRARTWTLVPQQCHEAPTGGESYPEMQRRISAFLDELRETGHSRVALFAHGGVLMCARVHAGQLPPAEALRQLTPFGGIVRITL